MQQTVGTTPVHLGDRRFGTTGEQFGLARPIVQNLGTGDLYLDFDPEVSDATGLKLEVGDIVEFQSRVGSKLYAVSDSSADVRVIDAG
jgi:hypothetical protein